MNKPTIPPHKPLTPYPLWFSLALSPALVAVMTMLLEWVQHFLTVRVDHYVRPYGIAYVIPIAVLTAVGGRRVGFLTLLLSLGSEWYFLISPRLSFSVRNQGDWVELGFLVLVGLLVVAGIDAMRRNAQLLASAQAMAAREALINKVNDALGDTDDSDALQETAARELASLLRLDLCYFGVLENDGSIRPVASISEAASLRQNSRPPNSRRPPVVQIDFARVFHDQEPLVVTDAASDLIAAPVAAILAREAVRAAVFVPIPQPGVSSVLLIAAMTDTPREWSEEEIATIKAVALHTRAAVQAARVRLRNKTIASVLQEALLPTTPETIPGLDVAPFYRPALVEASVGGDFYDVFEVTEKTFALVVGDVSGKGLAAAVQVAIVRNMLRCLLYQEARAGDAVTRLNDMLATHNLLSGFTTLFVGLYQSTPKILTYVSCGHEPGLLRRADTQTVEELAPTGAILGAAAGMVYAEESVVLCAGDMLAIYTDGVTDAGTRSDKFLGVAGLSKLLQRSGARQSAEKIVSQVMREVEAHADGSLRDDACLLIAVA
ncbi:hypothetical protein CCAX7_002190 [Capsulimonas corticalis]|uniref:Uncharacterized protein n=1 Tax=Capsulimonas corticalis TaxID=2219043 RepID=A0A402CRZ5_9BACT|nr:SpoIIE family protein phosphatase [Capsulimonas corticalis]BDI28168.1 hypothetical protein CCAX7_002190 [Capsulimonas corticalis]